MQIPPVQVSVCVHASASSQAVPSGRVGWEQTPVCESHVPAAWHWSCAVQMTGFAPMQNPFWQVSVCVQALPSLQVVPFGLLGFEHVPLAGLHVPAT